MQGHPEFLETIFDSEKIFEVPHGTTFRNRKTECLPAASRRRGLSRNSPPALSSGAGLCFFVTIITERPAFWVQTHLMEHRGIRYAIRIGIAREQWRVAIHVPGKTLPTERTVFGTRKDAEIAARSMINAWLKKRCAEPLNR
jgi:hypothetical protein